VVNLITIGQFIFDHRSSEASIPHSGGKLGPVNLQQFSCSFSCPVVSAGAALCERQFLPMVDGIFAGCDDDELFYRTVGSHWTQLDHDKSKRASPF
jgi:hypothetical protein